MFKTIADNRLTENDVTLNNLTSISRDARRIDARDASFDVIFSNSAIAKLESSMAKTEKTGS